MLDQDRILQFIHVSGPTTPSKVAKVINTDTLLASAHLSDLASQKKLKISYLKIGGTPLYYAPGQEERLYGFANGNINPKDYEVLELLKEKKILREQELELLPRVALRGLKDFAIPFNVTINNQSEIFWKYYLISDEERDTLVHAMLIPPTTVPLQPAQPILLTSEPLTSEPLTPHQTTLVPEHSHLSSAEEKQLQKPKERAKKRRTIIEDTFSEDVEVFFKKMKIVIEQKETLRKNAEMNYYIKVPSVVGQMKYFCKVKNKTKCDERDISTAYMEAQMKKLPLLFLYTEELNKKAQEMIDSGAFENVVVKRID